MGIHSTALAKMQDHGRTEQGDCGNSPLAFPDDRITYTIPEGYHIMPPTNPYFDRLADIQAHLLAGRRV
jgi:hypothetical protein